MLPKVYKKACKYSCNFMRIKILSQNLYFFGFGRYIPVPLWFKFSCLSGTDKETHQSFLEQYKQKQYSNEMQTRDALLNLQ